MRKIRSYRSQSKLRGFTLTELTLVLLAIGFIISVIWVTANTLWDNYRVAHATQEIVRTAQNIREYYSNAYNGGTAQLPAGGGGPGPDGMPGIPLTRTDITVNTDIAGLFPAEMRRTQGAAPGTTPIDNPFDGTSSAGFGAPADGTFHVLTVANGAGASRVQFGIRLINLSQSICMKMVMQQSLTDPELGVSHIEGFGGTNTARSKMDINPTTGVILNYTTKAGIAVATLPLTASKARAFCGTGAGDALEWDFNLRN